MFNINVHRGNLSPKHPISVKNEYFFLELVCFQFMSNSKTNGYLSGFLCDRTYIVWQIWMIPLCLSSFWRKERYYMSFQLEENRKASGSSLGMQVQCRFLFIDMSKYKYKYKYKYKWECRLNVDFFSLTWANKNIKFT